MGNSSRPRSARGARAPQAAVSSGGFDIPHMVEIGNHSWLFGWAPSQPLLRQGAGGRDVGAHEEPEEAKMLGCFLRGFGDDRQVQSPAGTNALEAVRCFVYAEEGTFHALTRL